MCYLFPFPFILYPNIKKLATPLRRYFHPPYLLAGYKLSTIEVEGSHEYGSFLSRFCSRRSWVRLYTSWPFVSPSPPFSPCTCPVFASSIRQSFCVAGACARTKRVLNSREGQIDRSRSRNVTRNED